MTRFARWTEIVLGVFFLVSAGAKAVDMDGFGALVSAYNVVKDPALVRMSSYAALIAEVILGAALLGGWRFNGLTHFLTAGMTVVYSGLITYAWQVHGLEDCGCIPGLVKLGPVESLIKNVVLLAILFFAWYGTRPKPPETPPRVKLKSPAAATALGATLLIVILGAVDAATRGANSSALAIAEEADDDRPFSQFVFTADGIDFDLGHGENLVALLSATCEHCQASVPGLNALAGAGDLPPMVGLMIGTDEEVDAFLLKTLPEFPLQQIEMLTFMSFIGVAPPRLHHVRDGLGVRHWDWDWEDAPPTPEEVMSTEGAPASTSD